MKRKDIVIEAKRIHESAMWSSQSQFEQAKIWSKRNNVLGVPSTGLAAIAGVAGLADLLGNRWTGFLAISASFLTAILTTLNYSKKIDQAHASANAYLALQQDARIFIEVDSKNNSTEELRELLAKLVARQQEINGTANITSPKARKKAEKNINDGRQSYEVDKPE
jgi:cell division protein FtsX